MVFALSSNRLLPANIIWVPVCSCSPLPLAFLILNPQVLVAAISVASTSVPSADVPNTSITNAIRVRP